MSGAPFPIIRSSGRWRDELPGSAWRWLLLPAWCVFRPAVAVRGLLYDYGVCRSHRLEVPVISVGNLTAGGTGKTPLVAYLTAWCLQRGLSPAVLSRGYRGDGVSNDEAALIDGCPVVCDPDRVRGAAVALQGGARCLILDDGFQHRRVHRDLDIVVIDATRPWGAVGNGSGAVLPLGYLRESPRALARAGLLAVSRTEAISPDALAQLLVQVGHTGRPLIQLCDEEPHLRPLHQPAGASPVPVARLAGRPVLLVSGIGNPLGFEASARRHGWQVLASRRFPDHHHYTATEVAALSAEATRLSAIVVVTSKDATKLGGMWPESTPGWVLEVRTGIRPQDRPVLDAILERTLNTPRPLG